MSRARDLADRVLQNRTHEDTDGGRESIVTFKGEQSGGEISTLAQIQASHDGTADDEKADLIFKTNDGSDGASPTERLRIDSAGAVITKRARSNTSGDAAIVVSPSDTTVSYGFRVDNANNALNFDRVDNTTTMMSLGATGNVGIGTSSPDGQLHLFTSDASITPDADADDLIIEANGAAGMTIGSSASSVGSIRFADSGSPRAGMIYYDHVGNAMRFYTGATERMRLDNSENLIIGKTTSSFSADGLVLSGTGNSSFVKTSDTVIFCNRLGTDGKIQAFYKAGVEVGSVVVFSGSTSYSTSSDYRMKENVADISDGITRVKQLAPKRFNFIADADTTVDGFLAHEAQAVVPEAVHGTKDEVEIWADGDELPDGVSVGDNKLDDDGKTIPVMQGIDQAKLVPLLTAALQEAIAKIETLETENAAIKARLDALEAE